MIIENRAYRNKYKIFPNRRRAGYELAKVIENESIGLVLAIPNGGVPVAISIIKDLNITNFNLLLIRKIQLPTTTEAGMGAVTPTGEVYFNNQLLKRMDLSSAVIRDQVDQAKRVIMKRTEKYDLQFPEVKNKNVLVVDDGIASGFSMIAGASWLQDRDASKIVIGTPTAPLTSLKKVEEKVDKIYCLNVHTGFPFAVANAYQKWYDVPEEQVITLLRQLKKE